VSEFGKKTISEANFCVHSTLPNGSFLRDKKDNTRTVPEAKEKATAPAKKRGSSGKNKVDPLLYRNDDAALACGVVPRTWRTWHRLGMIPPPIVIGKTNFWRVDELTKWVEAGCPHRRDWVYSGKKLSR
jgi:hypothetical protein